MINPMLLKACFWCIFALCLSSNSAFSEAAEIQWSSSKGTVVVVGDPYIELYTFPGRGYPRFHAIEKNEQIRIYKSRTSWYKVETQDGKVGWVPRKNLRTLHDLNGTAIDFTIPSWGEAKNPWQLGLLAGKTEGDTSYTIYTGYRFTPNISTELKYTQTFADAFNLKQASLSLVHQPFPNWRVSPFFSWGAGAIQTVPDVILVDPEDQQDIAISVGGGFMIYLTHNLLARIEYSQHTILTTRDNNDEVEEWKAGFSVLF